jgi:hypothetical protein
MSKISLVVGPMMSFRLHEVFVVVLVFVFVGFVAAFFVSATMMVIVLILMLVSVLLAIFAAVFVVFLVIVMTFAQMVVRGVIGNGIKMQLKLSGTESEAGRLMRQQGHVDFGRPRIIPPFH